MNRLAQFALVLLLTVIAGCDTAPGDHISQAELLVRIEEEHAPIVLDVRTESEFAASHITGATNIPHTEINNRLAELPADKNVEIVVHCKSGVRAGSAFKDLTAAGYQNVRLLEGHFDGWSSAELPMAHGVTR